MLILIRSLFNWFRTECCTSFRNLEQILYRVCCTPPTGCREQREKVLSVCIEYIVPLSGEGETKRFLQRMRNMSIVRCHRQRGLYVAVSF